MLVRPMSGINEDQVAIHCPICGIGMKQSEGKDPVDLPVPDENGQFSYTINDCMECECSYYVLYAETDSMFGPEAITFLRFV